MVDLLGDMTAELRELKRRIRVLESSSPLGYSSISEGALEIRSAEGLIVDGSARIDGLLKGSGTFDWTGPVNLKGAQSVTGPTTFTGMMTVNGPWKFVGNGEITGTVGLTGDLNVTGGGKIKAGNIEITPSSNGGTIKVGAHSIYVNGEAMTMLHNGGAQVVLNNGGVSLVNGGSNFTVGDNGVSVSGVPTENTSGLPSGTLSVNSSGFIRKAA